MNAWDENVLRFLGPAFQGKKVLLGVTGSIAAYKAPEIARALQKAGAEVRAVMTEGGARFITPLTLEAITRHPVTASMWEGDSPGTHHITSARWADLFLVAPASANQIAKIALGLAGDALGAECLAFRGPLAVAPAMNPAMLASEPVQRHLAALRSRGVHVLGPARGDTACGEEGEGRLLDPVLLLREWATSLCPKPGGKRACLTLGGTRARLDPVRFLANRSSGRMGAALAWALRARGIAVAAVIGPGVPREWLPADTEFHPVETTAELAGAVSRLHGSCDFLVAASAALDWSIEASPLKLKKEAGEPKLRFSEAPDALAGWGKALPKKPALGFAAETASSEGEYVDLARAKLRRKGARAVFVNPVGEEKGFESFENEGWFVTEAGALRFERAAKPVLAQSVVDAFLQGLEGMGKC